MQRNNDIVVKSDSNEARVFKFMSGSVSFLVSPQANYFPSCAYFLKGLTPSSTFKGRKEK